MGNWFEDRKKDLENAKHSVDSTVQGVIGQTKKGLGITDENGKTGPSFGQQLGGGLFDAYGLFEFGSQPAGGMSTANLFAKPFSASGSGLPSREQVVAKVLQDQLDALTKRKNDLGQTNQIDPTQTQTASSTLFGMG